jgi:ABC-type bacteriocin/lantibiotic exporter with double-glycine peptidase domain
MNIVQHLLALFLREEGWNISLLLGTSIVINILQTNGISFLTANIIQSLEEGGGSKTQVFFRYFVWISILYVLLTYGYRWFKDRMMTKMTQWLQFQIVKMILTINNHTMSNTNFTNINTLINQLTTTCFSLFTDIITYLIPNLVFLVVVGAYFFYHHAGIGTLFVAGNALLVGFYAWQWSTLMTKNLFFEGLNVKGEAMLVEILNNLDKIIYRGQTQQETTTYEQQQNKVTAAAFDYYNHVNANMFVMNAIILTVTTGSVFWLIALVKRNAINLTTFITLFTILLLYREKVSGSLLEVFNILDFVGHSQNIINHFETMSHDYQEVIATKQAQPNLALKTVEFRNVAYRYAGSDTAVFENVSMTMHTDGHKVIGITGLSGKGKSTFMKLLIKLYKCSAGSILIDGHDIEGIDNDYLRSKITYINQNSKLFDRTVLENLLFGCSDTDVCASRLAQIMAFPKIQALYHNINVETSSSGHLGEKLSGGQRQVANLISGLIHPSEILILDEPTNALDKELKAEIVTIIRAFKQFKQCIIIITHDKDVYPLFDEKIEI